MVHRNGSLMIIAVLISAAASSAILTVQPLASLAQEEGGLCGETITGNLEVTSDMTCQGDGITVVGNDLTIFMNGHTIRGPGSDTNTTGILVDEGVTVRIRGPGVVTGFGTGVAYMDASGGAMRDVYVGTNDMGVLLDSTTGTYIRHDYIADSRIGVFNRASDNTVVEEVQMNDNDEGIRLEKSTGADIDFNIIMDGLTALYLDEESLDNAIFYNIMFRNEVNDMNFASGEGMDAGNLLGYNECTQGIPADVCLGRVLPSGELLTGSKEHGEGIERVIQTQPEDLSPEEEQAAKALRERIIAGGSQNQTNT